MSDHYDVIVIGSGAGGGTLTHALAPTGKRILLLERGGYLPRETRELGSQVACGATAATATRASGPTTNGSQFTPKQHYYVGGNTKVYGAVLFRMRERDFGAVHHVDGVSPAWPLDYADFEPWYTRAEQLYRCTANGASTRPTRRRRPATRTRRSATSRGSSSSRTTCAAPGCTRSRCRSGSCIDEASAAARRRASAARPATGSPASSTARPTRRWSCVEPALEYPERHAAHRRAGHPARDRTPAARGRAGGRRARRGAGGVLGRRRRRRRRRDQLRGAAAAARRRPRTPTGSATAPAWSAAT